MLKLETIYCSFFFIIGSTSRWQFVWICRERSLSCIAWITVRFLLPATTFTSCFNNQFYSRKKLVRTTYCEWITTFLCFNRGIKKAMRTTQCMKYVSDCVVHEPAHDLCIIRVCGTCVHVCLLISSLFASPAFGPRFIAVRSDIVIHFSISAQLLRATLQDVRRRTWQGWLYLYRQNNSRKTLEGSDGQLKWILLNIMFYRPMGRFYLE